MAIDPGLNSMGWAYWSPARVANKEIISIPTRTGLIKAPRKLELAPRALWIARQLDKEFNTLGDKIQGKIAPHSEVDFVSEFPAWHGIQLGWAAGDLQRLVFLVGVLAGYFESAHSFTPVTPNDWKGQLPKSVVTHRLIKRFGPGATQEWEKDVWDAVGIGLWKMGKF